MADSEYNSIIWLSKVNKYTIIDNEDYEWLKESNWFIGGGGYAVKNFTKKKNPRESGTSRLMHRLIINPEESELTDHINGNRLDNRKSNLRLCTGWQNAMNTRSNSNSTGFKGVRYIKNRGRYAARITYNYKEIYLGYYKTAIEAADSYNKAALLYFGEFAHLNIV